MSGWYQAVIRWCRRDVGMESGGSQVVKKRYQDGIRLASGGVEEISGSYQAGLGWCRRGVRMA